MWWDDYLQKRTEQILDSNLSQEKQLRKGLDLKDLNLMKRRTHFNVFSKYRDLGLKPFKCRYNDCNKCFNLNNK